MNKKTTKLMATALTATMGAGIATQLVQAAEVTPYEAALEAVITMEKDPSGANIDKAYNAVVALKAGAQKDTLYKRVEKVAAPHHKAVYDIMVTARANKDLKIIGEARKAVAGMAKIFINDAYTWSSELDTLTIEYQKTVVDTLNAIANGKEEVKQATINELREIIVGLELQRSNEGLLKLVLDYSATLDKVQMDYVNEVLAEVKAATTEAKLEAAKVKYNDLLTMKDEALKAAVQSNVGAAIKAKEAEFATLKVESVRTINAKKIEVKFNKEVSKVEAENIANYTLVGITGFNSPVLQEDGKTVILTSATAIANDTTFVVTVSEISSKADVNEKTAKYTKTLTFSDTVRPTFNSVVYPKPGVAELIFSEELSTEGNVVVYDGLVESTTVTKKLDGNKITLEALQLNKEYKVVITGAKDQSGNLISAPIQVTVKNTISDNVKPVVNSIASQGIDTVKVQFSEAIQATGGVYASIDVNGSAATGTLTQTFDAKTNILTVSGIEGISNGEVKSITVKDFKDLANLNGEAVTKVIAFSTAAPALQSTQVVTEGSKTFAILTFDKAVAAISSEVNATYVTSENVFKTTKLLATVDQDKKQVKLEVTGKEAGSYTVSFAAGEISDGKTSNSKALDVKFNVGTSVDSSVPEVSNVFLPGEALPDTTIVEAGAVYVKYNKPMAASALNADNYTVDGSTIFSNPIFVGDKTLVKLSIKDSAITVSGSRNFAISNAVKGENNVAIKSYLVEKSFNENVKPVLTSASLIDDMTIELVFSELLGTNGFTTADNDFLVTVGGNNNVVTAVTDGTAGDNKVRITITDKITAQQLINSAITVKTRETADITDKVGNKLTANTSVNVEK